MQKVQVKQISETALIIYVGDNAIQTSNTNFIAQLCSYIRSNFEQQLLEVIPSYSSVLVEFNVLKVSYLELYNAINQFSLVTYKDSHADSSSDSNTTKCITLPVYYSSEVAPDLLTLAELKGITTEQVIEIHTQTIYSVCAIGFAPGFAFLASVDSRIATPRLIKPRLIIPAGSVGIADSQTAVYPDDSPGGWQIIGNCPVKLFDPTAQQMMPFSVGDSVTFTAINKKEFLELGGKTCQNWK